MIDSVIDSNQRNRLTRMKLLATGLLDACRGVDPASRRHAELTAQIKRLTLPGQMGEAVKVLALARDYDDGLTGFGARDLRGRL